jgi:hypothetical protein
MPPSYSRPPWQRRTRGPRRFEHWTFAGDELRNPRGRHRIAADTTRLDQIDDKSGVDPGVYCIDRDTLVWTRKLWVITFQRARVAGAAPP